MKYLCKSGRCIIIMDSKREDSFPGEILKSLTEMLSIIDENDLWMDLARLLILDSKVLKGRILSRKM